MLLFSEWVKHIIVCLCLEVKRLSVGRVRSSSENSVILLMKNSIEGEINMSMILQWTPLVYLSDPSASLQPTLGSDSVPRTFLSIMGRRGCKRC